MVPDKPHAPNVDEEIEAVGTDVEHIPAVSDVSYNRCGEESLFWLAQRDTGH